jgi:hypothetical protein
MCKTACIRPYVVFRVCPHQYSPLVLFSWSLHGLQHVVRTERGLRDDHASPLASYEWCGPWEIWTGASVDTCLPGIPLP